MSKHLKLLLVALFSLFVLVACGGGDDNATDSSSGGDGGSDSGGDKKTLVVADYGGASSEAASKAWYEPFAEEFGVEVIVVPNDIGKLKAMVDSDSVEWDVVINETLVALNLGAQGMLEPIDYDVVDASDLYEGTATEYTLGAQYSYTVISYNEEIYPNDDHPKSWAEFWDLDSFDGGRALWQFPMTTLESALLADGVAPEDMYPLDLDRAFASLDKIKDKVIWWDSGAQPPQLLTTKEVPVLASWNGRIASAIAEGAPLAMEFNEAIQALDSWLIPKGAPNAELAQEFLNFVIDPERQAEYARLINYGPTNQKAVDFLTDEEKLNVGIGAEDKIFKTDHEYWAENYDEINDRFNEWLLE